MVLVGAAVDGRTVVVVVDVLVGSTSRFTLIQPVIIGSITALRIVAAARVALMFFIESWSSE